MYFTRVENRTKKIYVHWYNYKCYSSSLVFHWLDLRQEKWDHDWPFLLYDVQVGNCARARSFAFIRLHPEGKLLVLALVIGGITIYMKEGK